MSVKLHEGKRYVCRNGAVVGPLEKNPVTTSSYPFWCDVDQKVFRNQRTSSWAENGEYRIGHGNDDYDIVAEYHEYVWKWMVPDKPGVWIFGGTKKSHPDEITGIRIVTKPENHGAAWFCFLMDTPPIQMPPKQRVTKRLWLRKEEHCLITRKTEEQLRNEPFHSFIYEERWEPNGITPEDGRWISTSVTKEFEE